MKQYSLQTQIAEVAREIAKRHTVYAHQVALHRMKQGEAEIKIEIMESVLATLKTLELNENL